MKAIGYVVADNGVKVMAVALTDNGYVVFPVIGRDGCNKRFIVFAPMISRNLSSDDDDIKESIAHRISRSKAEYNKSLSTYALYWNGTFIGTLRDGVPISAEYGVTREPEIMVAYDNVQFRYDVYNSVTDHIGNLEFCNKHDLELEYVKLALIGFNFYNGNQYEKTIDAPYKVID